jgi:hypothetical protein
MGYNVSNLAVRGRLIGEIHSILKLRPTDRRETDPESPVVAADLPSGWYLLYFNDSRLSPAEAQFAQLSAGAHAIYLDICDMVSASSASGWRDGRRVWSISHNVQRGGRDLELTGEIPDCFHSIAECLRQQQIGQNDIDYVFNVPAEVVNHQIGFRYDGDPNQYPRYDKNINGYPVDEFQILERLAPPRRWWQIW